MTGDATQRTSEEVDERQLELSSDEGDAYLESVEYMASEVAHTGDTQEAGDYVVGFAQEEADGEFTQHTPVVTTNGARGVAASRRSEPTKTCSNATRTAVLPPHPYEVWHYGGHRTAPTT